MAYKRLSDRLLTDIKGAKVLQVYEKHSNIEIRYIKDEFERSLSIYHNCRFSSMRDSCWFEFSGIPLHKYAKHISKRLIDIDTIKEINIYPKNDDIVFHYYLEIVYVDKQNQTKTYLLAPQADKEYRLEVYPNKKIELQKCYEEDVPYPKELYSIENYKKAFAFALKAHGTQTTPNGLPYSYHIVNVANEIISSLTFHRISYDEANVAIACALLHDVHEDTNSVINTYDLDIEHFKEIKAGVEALTKDKNLPKEVQMQDSLDRLQEMASCIQMVKLADRITNLDPAPLFWNKEKRKSYQDEAKMILKALKNSNPHLADKLQNKIDNYLVDGIEENLGFRNNDAYLVFYNDEVALILDKSHQEYLKTFKAINRLNEYLKKEYDVKLFKSWINREEDGIKEYQHRINIPYIEKHISNISDTKIESFMRTIYLGKDCII